MPYLAPRRPPYPVPQVVVDPRAQPEARSCTLQNVPQFNILPRIPPIPQVVVDPQAQPEVHAKAERLRGEWVVCVSGSLRARQDPNPRMATGAVELVPEGIKVGRAGGRVGGRQAAILLGCAQSGSS